MDRCDQGAKLMTLSEDKALKLAEFFKIAGDPNRIRILFLLMDKEICVIHIAEVLGMSQSAVSHQLRILRQQRLVRYIKDGKKTYYTLDDEHVRSVLKIGLDHIDHNGGWK